MTTNKPQNNSIVHVINGREWCLYMKYYKNIIRTFICFL